MRLPFMQLESDLLAHGGPELAILAGCPLVQAVGHVALLRAWAVSQATDDAPPDGLVLGEASGRRIEAAAQWTGERGALLKALVDVGQVAVEANGHRVLHLEPYCTAWERNAKAKARMANMRERSANKRVTGANGPNTEDERSAKFTGQTQTQMEDVEVEEASAPQGSADAGQQPEERPVLTLTTQDANPKPERKPRRLSAGEDLYQQVQQVRQQQCEKAGVPYVPDRWPEAQQNKMLGPVAKVPPGAAVDAEGKTEEFNRFTRAFAEYLGDEKHAEKGWPLSLFMHGSVRSRYEQQALMGVAS